MPRKTKHAELVAKEMRELALLVQGYQVVTDKQKLELVEDYKQIYFHAGRWVGGARDYTSRLAFEKYNELEGLCQ